MRVFCLLAAGAVRAAEPAAIDFEAFSPGALPAAVMAVEGEFRVAVDGRGKCLEMLAEPVVDGAVLVGPSLEGAGVIAARIKADRGRRAFPRMGVGLFGVSGVKLRLVPAKKRIEIVVGEDEVAVAPLEWRESVWWRIELAVRPEGDGWSAEGRAWTGEGARPDKPSVRIVLKDRPGQGRGALFGTPFANLPIRFDDVVVRGRP